MLLKAPTHHKRIVPISREEAWLAPLDRYVHARSERRGKLEAGNAPRQKIVDA